MTFMIGSGLYIARRATGLLIVPMAIHALWDFSAFTGDGNLLGSMATILALIVVVVALVGGRRRLFAPATSDQAARATIE
jgi:membrane protease YdiL (CAAX protease family)